MPDNKLLSLARSLRARAEEVLLKAQAMTDADARQKMREVAARYEQLAKREDEAGADDV